MKKTRNLNTFKDKMKHYYVNDLSNPNLWNVVRFGYALAIIENIVVFVKQISLHYFFPASLWLKDHNEIKAIRLFYVILAILVFISLILLLTSTFFYLLIVVNFSFFERVWLFNFFVPIWISFLYLFGSLITYLNRRVYILVNKIEFG